MFRKILHTFGTRAATAVLNLVIAIILSQVLGAEGKGQQGLIITTIAFILVFANLVGGATLVYLTPRYGYGSLLLPSYLWSVLTGIFAYLVLSIFPVIDPSFIIHVSLLSVVSSFVSVNSSLLIGKEKIFQSNGMNFLIPVMTAAYLSVAFFIMENETIGSYLVALYLAYGTVWVISLWLVYRTFGLPGRQRKEVFGAVIADLFRFGLLNQVAHITQMISFRLSYYILDEYHGEASLGIYSNAIQLAESIWLISKSISMVQYARIANVRDTDYAASLTVRLVRFSLLASALLLIPLLLLPPGVYAFVFGEEFGPVRSLLVTLAAGVLVYNISILIGHFFSGLGKYHLNAMASGIGMVVSIALYLWLIPAYGMAGAGWGTSISHVITSSVLLFMFRKYGKGPGDLLRITREDVLFVSREMRSLLKKTG